MATFFSFNSGGNDSVALLQWLIESDLKAHKIVSVYTNTGWAADYWAERMEGIRLWLKSHNIRHEEITTEGFEQLVRTEGNRKGEPPGRFPSGREKFCTRHLKILSSQQYMDLIDPNRNAVCCVGVRRAESERRRYAPAMVLNSENHGHRLLLHPLVELSDDERNIFVRRTPIELLDHRSDECEPCIFSTRADLRRVSQEKVATIRKMETDTGKTMFRPRAYAGATGIDEVMRWAWSERGQFKPPQSIEGKSQDEDGEELIQDCESDYCGL